MVRKIRLIVEIFPLIKHNHFFNYLEKIDFKIS